MWASKTSYRMIVNPNLKRNAYHPRPILESDLIEVKRLDLQGEWRILDMLSDDSIRAVLTVHAALNAAANKAIAVKRAPHRKVPV